MAGGVCSAWAPPLLFVVGDICRAWAPFRFFRIGRDMQGVGSLRPKYSSVMCEVHCEGISNLPIPGGPSSRMSQQNCIVAVSDCVHCWSFRGFVVALDVEP